ncbi:MAG: TRAM domain-containing protein [Treponema sp.]|jgi:23S rRNA (uracil1939-C5)-methyltransferase|nr:TRAM domain-containing protein [Treponema sp.]
MAAGDLINAEVERIAAGGAGLARSGGQAVFIPYTAPGDRIRARIRREHRGWAEADLAELVEASPGRTKPRCPLYYRGPEENRQVCGGCSLQHLDYESQLAAKVEILKEAFRRIARLPQGLPEVRVFPSPPWEYRNRVQLHRAGAAGGRFHAEGAAEEAVGFMAAKSGRVVPAEDCPVADPGIRALLGSGELRGRAGKLGAPAGRDRFTVYSRGDLLLTGGDRGRVRIRDRDLWMDTEVFFQSNGTMLELLIGEILDLAVRGDPSLPLADLYCGVGTFAAFLAGRFPRIELLEENPGALALGRKNVQGGEARFFALTDNEWVRKREAAGPYGLIIADPPRQGLSPAMRRWLAEARAPLLLYVSCDPAALARDSRELLEGWELEKLDLYDFYPQTAHIECLAVFRAVSP